MKTKQIIYGGLLTAAAIILPQLFHFIGPQAGKMMLPMYIPVLLAGLLLGPTVAVCIAVLAPVFSHLLTSMPAIPFLYFMMIELIVYGLVAGLLRGKVQVHFAILITFIAAKAAGGLCMMLAVWLLGFSAPFANPVAIGAAVATAIPGLILQLFAVPLILFAAKKVHVNGF